MELKEEMLLCHESQDTWLRAIFDDMDYVGFMRDSRSAAATNADGRGPRGSVR